MFPSENEACNLNLNINQGKLFFFIMAAGEHFKLKLFRRFVKLHPSLPIRSWFDKSLFNSVPVLVLKN